jgi:hypothetical protein
MMHNSMIRAGGDTIVRRPSDRACCGPPGRRLSAPAFRKSHGAFLEAGRI